MITIENLTRSFNGVIAVDALSLDIQQGELFALLGPNGAGKTTTINCLLGFLKPDSGRVLVDGVDVAREPLEVKRRLAYIPEQVNLYGHFTAVENLEYFAELGGHQYSGTALRGFLLDAGLQAEAHDRQLSGYSKGMRQKVGIAIALAKQAKVLILDEPTSGLDPRASYEFSRLLKTLQGRGMAILMATHDIFRALDVATRVGIMVAGVLREQIATTQIAPQELESRYLDIVRADQTRSS